MMKNIGCIGVRQICAFGQTFWCPRWVKIFAFFLTNHALAPITENVYVKFERNWLNTLGYIALILCMFEKRRLKTLPVLQ